MTTFIDFLLDETGSMSSCARETRAGFDNFIKSQREDPTPCYLTLVKFDSTNTHTPYRNLDINMVPPLSFFPNAMTNLYDTVVDRLTQTISEKREGNNLFVIMTDGADNTSNAKIEDVRLVVERAHQHGIAVVYLGPSQTAIQVGTRMGILESMIRPFDTANMTATMDAVSTATRAYRATPNAKEFF